MRRAGPRQSAFTLVELVVVLGIIAVLIGLLLPAVLKIRESAARLHCANHLKQLGLAFVAHHDARGAFPQGGSNDPGCAFAHPNKREQWSWCYQILPFIEQETLYHNADVNEVDTTPVKLYYCPARRSAGLYNGKSKVDYAGCAGTHPDNGCNGVVTRPPVPPCRVGDITDGTSSTVMLGDKQLNTSQLGHSQDDSETCFRSGWYGDYAVYRVGLNPPAADTNRAWGNEPSDRFGSSHAQGLNVTFADGSVRFVRYRISAIVWQRACVRNDGLVFDLNQL
jgi:prepilin-type N-terminal cleavage/methylation domain-containing protein/prepilin-type processing-associated H-X9-DG protein